MRYQQEVYTYRSHLVKDIEIINLIKEGAKDVPDWAKGNRPYKKENGDKFARRLLNEKYGKGNYSTKSQSEYSQIKKWGDRSFE